jgi:hypothetical protein
MHLVLVVGLFAYAGGGHPWPVFAYLLLQLLRGGWRVGRVLALRLDHVDDGGGD